MPRPQGSRATGGTTATGNVVSAIAAGRAHTCVVVDGEVRCWDFNVDGRLSNGTFRLGILQIRSLIGMGRLSAVWASVPIMTLWIRSGL